MSHLNICSTSYGQKKGRESNWQFDSRPLKVGNQPDPVVCKWSATHHWTFRPHPNWRFELGVMTSQSPMNPNWDSFRIPRTKSHSNVGVVGKRKEHYMGEGGGFP
jgi:hypothetical protein